MNKTLIFITAIAGLLAVGIGFAYMGSYGMGYGMMGYGMMGVPFNNNQIDYSGMYEELQGVLESGDISQLEALRNEYNMPIMPWIQDADDMDLALRMMERSGNISYGGGYGMMGGCPMAGY